MSVALKRIDPNIVILEYTGDVTLEDLTQPFPNIITITQEIAPNTLHVIYDAQHLDMTFEAFMSYIERAAERRDKGLVPTNMKQYLIGSNHWMHSLRQWLDTQYEVKIGLFSNLDTALDFIRDKKRLA